MDNNPEYKILPAVPLLDPPDYVPAISPWSIGFLPALVAFTVLMLLLGVGGKARENLVSVELFKKLEAAAICLSLIVYYIISRSQISAMQAGWMRRQIAEYEDKARKLSKEACQIMEGFYKNLQSLPTSLRNAEVFLATAEAEFHETAYAPFWDRIEQAVRELGAFNSSLAKMEAGAASYNSLLSGQVHNFPPLVIPPDAVPSPARQTDHLRQLVRMGQRDPWFATIWEHRATRAVLVQGFHSLGEAVNNLGPTINTSFSHVTRVIEEGVYRQHSEQVSLREAFESAVSKWEEQKRLYA